MDSEGVCFTNRGFRALITIRFSTMASATSKKTTKPTSDSSAQIKAAKEVEVRPVYLDPSTPAMTDEEAEAYILSIGGRPTTPEESEMFWKAIKDSPC
jgi:hypothetical protein